MECPDRNVVRKISFLYVWLMRVGIFRPASVCFPEKTGLTKFGFETYSFMGGFSFRFLWIGAVFVHVFSEHSASSFRTRSPSRLFFNDDGLGVEKQTLAGPSEHFHERSDAARVER